MPLSCSAQVSPLSVERNTPPPLPMKESVPAKIWPLLALIASAATSVDVRPLLVSVQLSPLSVERYTPVPQPAVPAMIVPPGLIAREEMSKHVTYWASNPLLSCSQVWPLSVDRNMPIPYVPA